VTALLAVLLLAGPAGGGVTPPRFSLDLVRVDAGQLPALHSYGWAGSNGKWLVLGGRTNGLHLFVSSGGGGKTPPPNAFPPSNANRMVWVIDPAVRRAWSAPVQNLPASIADHLSATNAQHVRTATSST
jgi:hypothetical protein